MPIHSICGGEPGVARIGAASSADMLIPAMEGKEGAGTARVKAKA